MSAARMVQVSAVYNKTERASTLLMRVLTGSDRAALDI